MLQQARQAAGGALLAISIMPEGFVLRGLRGGGRRRVEVPRKCVAANKTAKQRRPKPAGRQNAPISVIAQLRRATPSRT